MPTLDYHTVIYALCQVSVSMETAQFLFFEWQSICSSPAKQETILPLSFLMHPLQVDERTTVGSGPFN